MTSVAFVIPMFQSAATIRGCLNSIASQTMSRFEALIVDDGSTDDGPDMVAEAARKDPRIRLIRSPSNRGVAGSLNLGMAHTDAALIARLDADDEALPQRLERQVEYMAAVPDTVLCGSFVAHMGVSRARDRVGKVPVEDAAIKRNLHVRGTNPFYHPAVMFRRDVVMEYGGYREWFCHAEDRDLWLRLSRKHRMHNIAEPLIRYRINLSGESVREMWEQRRYARIAMESYRRPDAALEDLWHEVPAGGVGDERIVFLKQNYAFFVGELLRLGRAREASRLLVRCGRDVSWSYAASLASRELRELYLPRANARTAR